jgi:hypothetical protein
MWREGTSGYTAPTRELGTEQPVDPPGKPGELDHRPEHADRDLVESMKEHSVNVIHDAEEYPSL